jgi:hypothetical protein
VADVEHGETIKNYYRGTLNREAVPRFTALSSVKITVKVLNGRTDVFHSGESFKNYCDTYNRPYLWKKYDAWCKKKKLDPSEVDRFHRGMNVQCLVPTRVTGVLNITRLSYVQISDYQIIQGPNKMNSWVALTIPQTNEKSSVTAKVSPYLFKDHMKSGQFFDLEFEVTQLPISSAIVTLRNLQGLTVAPPNSVICDNTLIGGDHCNRCENYAYVVGSRGTKESVVKFLHKLGRKDVVSVNPLLKEFINKHDPLTKADQPSCSSIVDYHYDATLDSLVQNKKVLSEEESREEAEVEEDDKDNKFVLVKFNRGGSGRKSKNPKRRSVHYTMCVRGRKPDVTQLDNCGWVQVQY